MKNILHLKNIFVPCLLFVLMATISNGEISITEIILAISITGDLILFWTGDIIFL